MTESDQPTPGATESAGAPPRLLFFGAHPDDAEFSGGLLALYRRRGYPVKIVSVTDGSAGHQTLRGAELALRRQAEAHAAARVIGAECAVWDFPDGRLEARLELRERILSELRSYVPDLVLTHRPFDYHPDHRAVGQAVMDAGYLVTVPALVPDLPALERAPVIAQVADFFSRPVPFRPDVVVDVAPEIPSLVEMLHCHTSQVYEWLPFNRQTLSEVPRAESERKRWLSSQVCRDKRAIAEHFRERLQSAYGEAASSLEYVEAYEISEYGRTLDPELELRLFPGQPRAGSRPAELV